MQDIWRLYNRPVDYQGIAREFRIPEPLAVILGNRGIVTPEAIRKFLYGSVQDLYDPFLMKGVKEGTELLADTLRRGEKILVVGDYDADGVCSSYILQSFLSAAGGNVSVRIPNRMEEGYGFNPAIAEEAGRDGVSLLITCDNGISAFDAVKRANELGIAVIVTDHHEPSETLPQAQVVIDPKQAECTYPFRELCGAGVAYKLIQALNWYMGLHLERELDELLAFAAIATIADVVPLRDENRILAAEGLKVLRRTQNPGLWALAQVREIDLSQVRSEDISFNIAPCINSAGRLKSADLALDLFRAHSYEEALQYARELSDLNEERKDMTNQLEARVIQEMEEKEKAGLDKILVIFLPDAHESLAGLIAGRLMERYYRPVLVVTESGGVLKGSARSTPKYDIIGAIREHGELFEKSGGHKRACGFTLKRIGTAQETVEQLSRALNGSCTMTEKDLQRKVWIDVPLPFNYLNETFIDCLEMLEPYGADNDKPLFGAEHIRITNSFVFGRFSNALKVIMDDGSGCLAEAVMFGNEEDLSKECERLLQYRKASVLFQLSMNEYKGKRSPKVMIRGLRVTETSPDGH